MFRKYRYFLRQSALCEQADTILADILIQRVSIAHLSDKLIAGPTDRRGDEISHCTLNSLGVKKVVNFERFAPIDAASATVV